MCVAYEKLKQEIGTLSKWQGSHWLCRSCMLLDSWVVGKFWSAALSLDQEYGQLIFSMRGRGLWGTFKVSIYVHPFESISIYLIICIYLFLFDSPCTVSYLFSISISFYFDIYGQRRPHHSGTNLMKPKGHWNLLRPPNLSPRLKSCHGCATPAQAETQGS